MSGSPPPTEDPQSVLRRRPPPNALRWVEASVGPHSRVVNVQAFRTGNWLANHAVDVVDAQGARHRLVLRRWARPGWDVDDPDFTAQREANLLNLLAPTAVPAPRLVAVDSEGTACAVPALLMTRLPGAPPNRVHDLPSFVSGLAGALTVIHAVTDGATAAVPPYRRYHPPDTLVLPKWLPPSPVWRRAFDAVTEPPPATRQTFIHRDYHPGNTLWSRGRLTGVVDWTQASWGPPGVDIGHMRWNLAVDYGPDIADLFLASYRTLSADTFEHHPYWDLVTTIDLVADISGPYDSADLARLESHVEAALARL